MINRNETLYDITPCKECGYTPHDLAEMAAYIKGFRHELCYECLITLGEKIIQEHEGDESTKGCWD